MFMSNNNYKQKIRWMFQTLNVFLTWNPGNFINLLIFCKSFSLLSAFSRSNLFSKKRYVKLRNENKRNKTRLIDLRKSRYVCQCWYFMIATKLCSSLRLITSIWWKTRSSKFKTLTICCFLEFPCNFIILSSKLNQLVLERKVKQNSFISFVRLKKWNLHII